MQNKGADNNFIACHIGKPLGKIYIKMSRKAFSFIAVASLGMHFGFTEPAWSQSIIEKGLETPIVIIPQSKQANNPYPDVQPESYESYQIRILRNQNNLQADKIRTLREEVMELNRKIHELTPHLFNKGDPADQEKIASLSLRLVEKEKEFTAMLQQKQHMEIEHAQSSKKLNEMETVREALASMIDKQRTSQIQSTAQFTKQIEDLRNLATEEKNQLIKKINDHETLQQKLHGEIAEKAQTILRLDAVATQQDYVLSANEQLIANLNVRILRLYDELLITASAYTLQQQIAQDQIAALVQTLDLEQTRGDQLHKFKNQMEWISDLYEATTTFLNDEIDSLKTRLNEQELINKELQIVKAELDSRKQEITWLLAAYNDYKTEANAYINVFGEAWSQQETEKNDQLKMVSGLLLHLDDAEMALDHQQTLQNELEELLAGTAVLLEDRRNKVEQLEEHVAEVLANFEREQLIVSTLEVETNSYKNMIEELTDSFVHLEKKRVKENEKAVDYITYYSQLLDDASLLSYQLELVFEDLHRAALLTNLEIAQDLYLKEIKLELAQQRQTELLHEISALQNDKNSLSQRITHLETVNSENEQKQAAIIQLKTTNENLNENLKKSLSQGKEADVLSYQLEMMVEDANAASHLDQQQMALEIQSKLDQLSEMKQAATNLEETIEMLKGDHSQQLNEATAQVLQLELMLEEAYTANRANSTLAELELKSDELQAAHQALTTLDFTAKARADEIEELTQQLAALAEVKGLTEEQAAYIAALEEQNQESLLALEDHLRELNEARTLALQHKALVEELERIKLENSDLAAQLSQVEDENVVLAQSLANLQDEWKKETEAKDSTYALLQSQQEQDVETLAQTQKKLEETVTQANTLEIALEESHRYLVRSEQKATDELFSKQRLLQLAQEEIQNKEQAIAHLQSQNEKNSEKSAQMQQHLDEAAKTLARLELALEESRQQQLIAEQKAAEELRAKNELLELASREKETLQDQLYALDKENYHLTEHAARLERWKVESHEKEEWLAKLQTQLETEKAINSSLQSDLNYARMNYVQEQRNKRNLEQLYQEGQQKLTSLENKLSQHVQEIASRDHSLHESQMAYEYLLMQLKELSEN